MKRALIKTGLVLMLAAALAAGTAALSWAKGTYIFSCIGDSLTENNYTRFLPGIFDANASYQYTLYDNGRGGYTTSMILSEMQSQNWMSQGPDFVLIMAGTNNMVHGQTTDPDVLAAQVGRELQQIVDIASYPNSPGRPRIIVSAIPPSTNGKINARAGVYNWWLRNNLHDVDIFTDANWHDFWNGTSANTDLMANYLHPTDEGYQMMAQNFYDAVDAVFNESLIDQNPYLHKMADYGKD